MNTLKGILVISFFILSAGIATDNTGFMTAGTILSIVFLLVYAWFWQKNRAEIKKLNPEAARKEFYDLVQVKTLEIIHENTSTGKTIDNEKLAQMAVGRTEFILAKKYKMKPQQLAQMVK